MANRLSDSASMKMPPVTVSPDLRITLPAGGVVLSTAQAIRLADELAYRAYLRQSSEREKRRAAARARRQPAG